MATAIQLLKNKRSKFKGSITRLESKWQAHDTTPLLPPAIIKLSEQLPGLFAELNTLHDEICGAVSDEDYGPHGAEYESLMDRLEALNAGLNAALEPPSTIPQNSDNNQHQNRTHGAGNSRSGNPQHKFKLQKLELPDFDGDVLKWMSFQNSFKAAVHLNPTLSDSERLQYLKSSLKGEASSRIEAFQIQDENFNAAWEVLVKRYEDKKAIICATLKRLFNQQAIQTDSVESLRKFVDTINECIRSLKVLEAPVEHWDIVTLFFLVEKLDGDSRRQWELSLKAGPLPTLVEFTDFLELRARSLSSIPTSKTKPPAKHIGNQVPGTKKTFQVSGGKPKCCDEGNHPLYVCTVYKNAQVSERWEMAKKLHVCFNCLKKGHSTQECRAGTCKTCDKKHHSTLHSERKAEEAKDETKVNHALTCLASTSKQSSQVLLATALVKIPDAKGTLQIFRALIDPGSQASFISENCKQKTGLKSQRTNLPLTGLASAGLGTASQMVTCSIVSCIDEKVSFCVHALVLPRITGSLPNTHIATRNWKHIRGLKLADPSFHTPSPVDILLGADIITTIMKEGMRRGLGGTPAAWNSSLGWLLLGNLYPSPTIKTHFTNIQLESALERFWKQEEISSHITLTEEERRCEDHFASTHRRENNRYVVELPFKKDPSILGHSRQSAIRRLLQVERQLAKDPLNKVGYTKFIHEGLTLGHWEPMSKDEVGTPGCYLPHHFVLKESSTTTKLRVVFSGKDTTSSGHSLNSILMVGPKLQPDLIATLLRFRTFTVAFTSDIVKMYRQVLVAPQHRDYQRIVWRDEPTQPIQDYRLKTVTYGTSSAPYQAVKALQQLAMDYKEQFPHAAYTILNSFYVDDLLGGAATTEEALVIYNQLMQIMELGSFELRKWASNDVNFLEAVPQEFRATPGPQLIEDDESIKTLGIRWHPMEDYFSFDVESYVEREPVTKRMIMSDTLKTFDPFGALAPVTVRAKIFIQQLWKNSCKWDDPLPVEAQESWKAYQVQIKKLEDLKIQRCITMTQTATFQLHGFCDASEKAFAAAVYLRCRLKDGTVQTRFIASKTKVAPLKQISLPRLELCSALLLVRLIALIKPALNLEIEEMHAWSDSEITLCWIAAHPSRWKTFVANRVTEIQETMTGQWHHVRSEENPADCASRGISPTELITHPLWWEGPQFLHHQSFDSQENIAAPEGALHEERMQVPLVLLVTSDFTLLDQFSSLTKLQRVTAYIYRFAFNSKNKTEDRKSGPLTMTELNKALYFWVKEVQTTHYQPEVTALKTNNPIPKNSKLKFLNPFIDNMGVLRVGGRLRNANISFDKKFPCIIPSKGTLTNLILSQEHLASLHGGAQLMWATVARRFWIQNGRDVIRQHIRKCVPCFRHRRESAAQMMADLPAARVNRSRAFLNCGVDYAGPFKLRNCFGRSPTTYKGWIALFVCFTTRAIHLELVTNSSTSAFLAALKRFISRRGRCQTIHSDVGTNFVGANNELKRLLKLFQTQEHNNEVAEFLATQTMDWKFNSPGSPHMGGLWEAGVKSLKHHLYRVVGTHTLSYEEFNTILCQIEACLNSRPLCPMSSDPNDLSALTPGHFLIGEALNSIPEPDLTNIKENRLTRWQHTQQIIQKVWTRWSSELITRLQQRPKWLSPQPNLVEGTLVLLKEENLPPLRWKLGRILKLHPGKDGLVRIATIKTETTELTRPIVKLCPLPIDEVIP